jgi:hypothetical protein
MWVSIPKLAKTLKTLTSINHLPLLQLDGDSEAPDFDRRRVFLRRQKNTMRFDISMNDVILVAVADSFQYLPHVVTAKRQLQTSGIYIMVFWVITKHKNSVRT